MTRLPRWIVTAGAVAGVTILPVDSMVGPIAASQQQAGRPQFRMNVDLVTVDVSVRDGNQPVNGLTAADFVLTDNGVQQEIDVADLSSLPIEVTVLIDTSGSMAGDIDAVVAQARARRTCSSPATRSGRSALRTTSRRAASGRLSTAIPSNRSRRAAHGLDARRDRAEHGRRHPGHRRDWRVDHGH